MQGNVSHSRISLSLQSGCFNRSWSYTAFQKARWVSSSSNLSVAKNKATGRWNFSKQITKFASISIPFDYVFYPYCSVCRYRFESKEAVFFFQPPSSILAQVQLLNPVPIHTISFNCADTEANQFLCQLAAETGGRCVVTKLVLSWWFVSSNKVRTLLNICSTYSILSMRMSVKNFINCSFNVYILTWHKNVHVHMLLVQLWLQLTPVREPWLTLKTHYLLNAQHGLIPTKRVHDRLLLRRKAPLFGKVQCFWLLFLSVYTGAHYFFAL